MKDIKKQIFEKSKELFLIKDYDDITVDEICKACDISKPTFYYHLNSKDDIIIHIYDTLVLDMEDLLLQLAKSDDEENKIKAIFKFLMKRMMELGPDLNKQLFIISLKNNLDTFKLRNEIKELGIHVIKQGQSKGIFKNQSCAESLFESLAYMFTGYEFMWCNRNGDFPWEEKFFRDLENVLII